MNKNKLGNLHSSIDIRCCVILIVGILITNCFIFNTNPSNFVFSQGNPAVLEDKIEKQIVSDEGQPYLGVNMRGYYTSMPQSREFKFLFPDNYYETSFKTLSKANAIDHIRYRF